MDFLRRAGLRKPTRTARDRVHDVNRRPAATPPDRNRTTNARAGDPSDFVSVDGSPLALYLAIPAGDAPTIIHNAIPDGASILELGSGPGRLTRVLVAYGHHVTAVDDSQEMLQHVTGARRVCADLHQLTLADRFDVVLGASHLINEPDPVTRHALLQVCRRHVTDEGLVLLERYPPGWAISARDSTGNVGPVRMEFEAGALVDGVRAAAITYRLGSRSWRQEFTAVDVEDAMLAAEADQAGLRFEGALDDAAAWVVLRPGTPRRPPAPAGPGPTPAPRRAG